MYINNRTILKVSELNAEVSLLLSQGFPLLWVEGEISNFSRPASGHMYFSLKDAKAQIRCAMFKSKSMRLTIQPANGMKVLVRGRIGLYETRGEFQLVADHIEEAGAGLLQRQFEELKAKLSAKGWFDPEKKKNLPSFPKQIGIISSPTGAALRDILHVLKRRCPHIPILIYPAAVQGAQAAGQLETAIRHANISKACDVLILARGGGSIEDLAAFNDENLARAIYESELPIITGIGHEIDFSVADFIADKRAPTPSAAAEIVSPDIAHLRTQLFNLQQKLLRAVQQTFQQKNTQLSWLTQRLAQQKPSHRLQQQSQRLDELELRLKQSTQRLFDNKKNKINTIEKQLHNNSPRRLLINKQQHLIQQTTLLQHAMQRKITASQSSLALQATKLDAISPLKTLDRGYAIVKMDEVVIRSTQQLSVGQHIRTKLKEGEIVSEVTALHLPLKTI